MTYDIVIVTYNNAATLARCLASLPPNTSPIVVDNASSDNTAAVAAKSGVAVHRQARNAGFASAANFGASLGHAPYIFFLNPDAYLVKPTIKAAIDYLETHAPIAALGLQLMNEQGETEVSFGPPVSLISLFTNRRRARLPRRQAASPTGVGWVSGGALLVRRQAFADVGGFDPSFFLYWEDIDLGKRLASKGWRLVYFPHMQVIHERGVSLRDGSRKTQLYDESADKYFRKHYPPVIWRLQQFLRRLYRLFSPRAH